MYLPHNHYRSGMTLIEIAVAIIIVGVMLGAALQLYNQNRDQYAKKITEERMNHIVSALSKYAETNYRIPCPADPSIETARVAVTPTAGREPWRFGHEWNATAGTATTRTGIGNCTAAAQQHGLIPFQTLGIPFEYAKDGWGNYFTYAVSPVFTQQTDFADSVNNDRNDQVHERCRTQGWILGNYPVNAPKARFCCVKRTSTGDGFGEVTDLRILSFDGGSGIMPQWPNQRDNFPTRYGALNSIARSATVPPRHVAPSGNIEAVAFVLMSHGRNGRCSWLGNDTANRKPCNFPEMQNGNTDRAYYTGRTVDDIVVWMTQFGLMAYNGGSSCVLP